MSNRLALEVSPYLLQHAENPVDWFAWGPEAIERARQLDRPIFLSIGYSTCHWCHVMEHESFENDEIARVLNDSFVSIKVDREERPDIDRVYMTFVQATSGSGGWPMSVWLTPDLQPFYGGTYFPPSSRWGRPGFIDVLGELARVWRDERPKVVELARTLTDQLKTAGRASMVGDLAGPEALAAGVQQFEQSFDRRRGGFGDAPKFPRPSELLFLLREFARTGNQSAREMALATLKAMALGGMRDHVGGGFHRYSVDADWRVPHFEKMLYDQAQLVLAYLEAAQATGQAFYAGVAEDTLQYVRREMTAPEGGFYSAEDADSVPPDQADTPHPQKREGAFYLWSAAELTTILGDDAQAFALRHGIEADGNAPADPHGDFAGRNLLYLARSVEDVARELGETPDSVAVRLNRARLRLFEARLSRPRPHLDDKVLTAWNGLMIAAFARGARVLGALAEEAGDDVAREQATLHLATARAAALFIKDQMWEAAGNVLYRRHRVGRSAIAAYAEDYAGLIFGLLELFQADANPAWLEWALALQDLLDKNFWDEAQGGWFSTTGHDSTVLLRLKDDYDGAEPSATSMATNNLITLAHLTAMPDHSDRVERALRLFGHRVGHFARAVPMMMCALSAYHAGVRQIIVVGNRDGAETRALSACVSRRYLPFSVFVAVEPGGQQDELARHLPFVGAMQPIDGRSTAFVCRGFTCERPVTDVDRLASLL
jgi:uncharacterized protein YyaL (SSP411 family)